MIVFINPAAGGGTALQKWHRIAAQVRQRCGAMTTRVLDDTLDLAMEVDTLLGAGETDFVAAGGDGTVNLLVNALMAAAPPERLAVVRLGAIGLGSSNDYHKPLRADRQIDGIPCKLDVNATCVRDVGVLTFGGEGKPLGIRYWIVNASIGLTATANDFFNTRAPVFALLKRRTANGAILYAALRTISTYHTPDVTVQVDAGPLMLVPLTNLSVVKSPHVSGGFCYDSPLMPDDGRFFVHLCEDMSLPRTLFTLWKLSNHAFTGLPKTRSWSARHVAVEAKVPFAVEFDGEMAHTRRVVFSMAPQQLNVCS